MCSPKSRAKEFLYSTRAQSTLEFALVFFAVLSIVVALAILWRYGSKGMLAERAGQAASHSLGKEGVGGMQDILMY